LHSSRDKSSKYTANKYGLNTPPYLTPLVTWNGSDKCLPRFICIVCSLYQCFSNRTKHIGTYRWINFPNNFLYSTRSNAFEASKKKQQANKMWIGDDIFEIFNHKEVLAMSWQDLYFDVWRGEQISFMFSRILDHHQNSTWIWIRLYSLPSQI